MGKKRFSKIFLTRLGGEDAKEGILVAESINPEEQVGKISEEIEKSESNFLLVVCSDNEITGLLRYFRERYQEENIVRIIIREEGEREKSYSKIMYLKDKASKKQHQATLKKGGEENE